MHGRPGLPRQYRGCGALLECVKKNHVFGKIVYCEREYCHLHTLGAPALDSYKDWRKHGAPMWYPTHATAYYVAVTHDSLLDVSCLGTAPFDAARRRPNGISNVFNSEVACFEPAREASAA